MAARVLTRQCALKKVPSDPPHAAGLPNRGATLGPSPSSTRRPPDPPDRCVLRIEATAAGGGTRSVPEARQLLVSPGGPDAHDPGERWRGRRGSNPRPPA